MYQEKYYHTPCTRLTEWAPWAKWGLQLIWINMNNVTRHNHCTTTLVVILVCKLIIENVFFFFKYLYLV